MPTSQQTIYAFSAEMTATAEVDLPALSLVGGKGLSLMRMAAEGLPVPPGCILSVDFFSEWIATLQQTSAWERFVTAPAEQLKAACDELKARAGELSLSQSRRQELAQALSALPADSLFAVRSSSPEEDLAGASFAGAYETVLGVDAAGLEAAIRRAFASCLDARIVIYKQQHGFDPRQPRIAVVIQQQIAAETAGVGFSLDPVSNDYDLAVISANWGLGESVVSGLASPDTYLVDKPALQLRERRLGRKELAILPAARGTRQQPDYRSQEWTLDDGQACEITALLIRLEALYEQPIDCEWAFAGERLYLLQARPITGYLPLPEKMLTAPGAPRRLYGDFTISIQGIYEPLSVLGTDFFSYLLAGLFRELLGHDISDRVETALMFPASGRIYFNFSNLLALAGRERLADLLNHVDSLAAAMVRAIDAEAYAATDFDRRDLLRDLFLHLPHRAGLALEAGLMPEHARQSFERAAETYQAEIAAIAAEPLELTAFAVKLCSCMGHSLAGEFLPAVALSRVAIGQLKGFFPAPNAEETEHLLRLDRSLPHNVTIEMGLALEALAGLLEPPLPPSAEALATALAEDRLPSAFVQGWSRFLADYGHRGPREIDVAAPRYRERPELLLAQILQLAQLPSGTDGPGEIYARSQQERAAAYAALAQQVHARGWLQGKRFDALYRIVETLGGYRERPKFEIVRAMALCRERVLALAQRLVAAGRLDTPEQAFDLKLADLERAAREPELNLRELAAERRLPVDRLARLPRLPQVFDSRGRIFTPPRAASAPNQLSGQPISAGVIQGPVKVLHSPDEKPLLPGDILVARATDPGWTPLFVNAGAIVLEVGGLLQHGALVAREYGKPCVAGVDDATGRLHDGEWIEVDGSTGLIRQLAGPPSAEQI